MLAHEPNRNALSGSGGLSLSLSSPIAPEGTRIDHLEVSVRGKWVTVPALNVDGNILTITGKWIRVAAVHDEEWLERELADPELYIRTLKKTARPCSDIFTFTQMLPATKPKYDYPLEWVSVALVHVQGFKSWWENLPQETRKNVRRSEKRGVVVRLQEFNDELIRGIADVQNETPMRQGRRYPHYGKTFDQVKKDHSGFVDHSDFICAYSGDELIGFLKLVYRGNVASILQLNSKISHYDKRPANALLAKAVDLCSSKGLSFLTYGRFNYGNKTDSSLRDFKARNGFCEVLLPRFYVPLTTWGKFCVRAKLYRDLLEILPSFMIMTFVRARAKWYSQKESLMSRCSSMPERPNRDRQMECSNPPAGSNPSSNPPSQGQDLQQLL